MNFISFPDIESFSSVVKSAANFLSIEPPLAWPAKGCDEPRGILEYRGKIKLHGTAAGLRIENGQWAAQSRSKLITPTDDNAGFARWAETHSAYWSSLRNMTVFGEWCGQGIMKGTAINQIGRKVFAVFAVFLGNSSEDELAEFITEPEEIEALLGVRPEEVHVLPWYGGAFSVDYLKRSSLLGTAEALNAVIAAVEPVDPWVKEVFGKEGTCEGVVYYPGAGKVFPRYVFSNFAFKAKGEKHAVKIVRESVQVDPEVAKTVDEFVKMFVTEPRLEQGLATLSSIEKKNAGQFLKWMAGDILKESKNELEAANLSWEDVQKDVQTAARTWFLAKCEAI